jgi:hypothetical protein
LRLWGARRRLLACAPKYSGDEAVKGRDTGVQGNGAATNGAGSVIQGCAPAGPKHG